MLYSTAVVSIDEKDDEIWIWLHEQNVKTPRLFSDNVVTALHVFCFAT